MNPLSRTLLSLNACPESVAWAKSRPRPRTYRTAWETCPRGDWLLWLAATLDVDRRLLVLAACDCAEIALVHVPAGEERPRRAIETARRWARGEATIEEVRAAASAASVASAASYAAASVASAASYAATSAAYAADAAARAYASAYDTSDASYAAERAASLARSADLVRARIPWPVVRDALRARAGKGGV